MKTRTVEQAAKRLADVKIQVIRQQERCGMGAAEAIREGPTGEGETDAFAIQVGMS